MSNGLGKYLVQPEPLQARSQGSFLGAKETPFQIEGP